MGIVDSFQIFPPVRRDKTYRVVIGTGSQDWVEESSIEEVMEFLRPDVLLYSGNGGSDWFMHRWAVKNPDVGQEMFKIPPKQLDTHRKGARHRMNLAMAERGLEWRRVGSSVLVVAFSLPEEADVFDMMDIAVGYGFPVLQYH